VDEVTSIAALSSGMHQASLDAAVAIRTMKMANDQQAAVLELLLKTMEMSVSGAGQYVDVRV
jgi:hypothetical protein